MDKNKLINNNYLNKLYKIIKHNIRDYGMYIALIVIMVYFNIMTSGLFMSPININNLFLQTGYIAVLGVGMTLVIVIRHIDLSVGYVAGFLGAVAAILLVKLGIPLLFVVIVVLLLGILVGLWNGFLVAKVGIPSFVTTLAGMLIFRGALLKVTKSETILPNNDALKEIGSGHIPSVGIIENTPFEFLNGAHVSTVLLGLLGIILIIVSEILTRRKKKHYNFEVLSIELFVAKIVLISSAIFYITTLLANYKGLPWTVLIVLIVVSIYHFITNNTVLGRHIYAVGGNPEAAKLSGINVKLITYIVFGSMSMLAALSGILYTARLNSAAPSAGAMFELDAIAAAYIGGVSAAGGVGKVTGAITGALVMASLTNGMNLMGVGISYQYIIRGLVLVAAVVFDVKTRNIKAAH